MNNLLQLCYYTDPLYFYHALKLGPHRASFNLVWYFWWTDRCSCPCWEIVYLKMLKSILISPCLSGMKIHSYNLCLNVNMYTYIGPKLCRAQILEGEGNYLSAQGAPANSAALGVGCTILCSDKKKKRASLHYLQCTAHTDKISMWLLPSVTADPLFGQSRETEHVS